MEKLKNVIALLKTVLDSLRKEYDGAENNPARQVQIAIRISNLDQAIHTLERLANNENKSDDSL